VTDPDVQIALWQELSSHLNEHFYKPDLQALRAVFATVHAHYAEGDPVWLFVIGPARSGKTSVAINCISNLPDVTVESDLTPRSFIVGKKGKDRDSLLQTGKNVILAFKDFTTMISRREDDQKEIMATLREVYDGSFRRRTAEVNKLWTGKATVIAACTPAIERAWAIHRDLGERFSQVRWHNSDNPQAVAKQAREQIGNERAIGKTTRELVDVFFSLANGNIAGLPDRYGDQIDAAATMIARLRCNVIRDSHANRQIIDVSTPEEPTTLAKNLATIATHHAALFGSDTVSMEDMKLAMRMALDTVPSSRSKIISNLTREVAIPGNELREMCEVHKNTILWQTDELQALGLIEISETITGERAYRHSMEMDDLWNAAKF
jgi:hypothetical protein